MSESKGNLRIEKDENDDNVNVSFGFKIHRFLKKLRFVNSLHKCNKADHKNLAFLTKLNENQHLPLFSEVVCLKSQLSFVKHSEQVY